MADKVCKKRRYCATPFFSDILEKPEGGSQHPPPPIKASVKGTIPPFFDVFKVRYAKEAVWPFPVVQTAPKTSLSVVCNLALKVAFYSFFTETVRKLGKVTTGV